MDVVRLTSEQIAAAVVWWSKAIIKPEFHTLERGAAVREGERAAAFSEILATVAAKPKTEEQVTAFAKALSRLLAERNPRMLDVDYGPDPILFEAATEAGIPSPGILAFPWKTSMWLDDGKVVVRAGYGAQSVLVYAPVTPPAPSTEAGA